MSGRGRAALALTYDDALKDVEHALVNLTRSGDRLVAGTLDHLPYPGLRLKGLDETVQIPLTTQFATQMRGRLHPAGCGDSALNEFITSEFELGNPKWEVFVQEILESARKPLGISEKAQMAATASQLVLVQEGGRFQSSILRKKGHGVFGALALLLPGEFCGGDVLPPTLRKEGDSTARNRFSLSYATFYRDYQWESPPVSSGTALYLVYDLATSTISEITASAGPAVLQESVETSLRRYFDIQLPPSKRVKIGADACKAIREFASTRHFAYIVQDSAFDKIQGTDRAVMESLTAFCEHSGGEYALYLSGAIFTRKEDDFDLIYPRGAPSIPYYTAS